MILMTDMFRTKNRVSLMIPQRQSVFAGAISAFAFILVSTSSHAQTPVPAGLEKNVPKNWVDEQFPELDQKVERLSVAYSLSSDAAEALRSKMVATLETQYQFEQALAAENAALAAQIEEQNLGDDSPQGIKLLEGIRKLVNESPLSELTLATEIERSLSTDIAAQGRSRLLELIERESNKLAVTDEDLGQVSAHNGSMADGRMAAEAPLSPQGNPLPRGGKLPVISPEVVAKVGGETAPSLPVQPNPALPALANTAYEVGTTSASNNRSDSAQQLEVVKATADAILADPTMSKVEAKVAMPNGRTAKNHVAESSGGLDRGAQPRIAAAQSKSPEVIGSTLKGSEPSRPVPAAVEAVRLQAAPPLDDWDKYVDTTCKKFEFSDAQVIKAQSILKDLRNRASAYRTSRNEDFAAAERLADAKAKADRKKELSAPIDAFFEELKQRLDNLATLEQRAKASAAAPGKK